MVGADVHAHGARAGREMGGGRRKPASSGSAARRRRRPRGAARSRGAARGSGSRRRRRPLGELGREPLALVAQRVVLRGDDQRRRQRVQPVGRQRREVRVGEVPRTAGVLLPVPGGLAGVEARSRPCGRTRPPSAGRGTGRSAPAREPAGLRSAATRARLPPALSPWAYVGPRARAAASRASQRSTVSTSSGAAGNGCSGGRR